MKIATRLASEPKKLAEVRAALRKRFADSVARRWAGLHAQPGSGLPRHVASLAIVAGSLREP